MPVVQIVEKHLIGVRQRVCEVDSVIFMFEGVLKGQSVEVSGVGSAHIPSVAIFEI